MDARELLEGVMYLSRKDRELFLNSSYLGVKWRQLVDLRQQYVDSKGLTSDFNNEVLKLIIETAGDWDDCLPYGPECLEKLTDSEKEDLNSHVAYVNKVIEHYHFRQASLWGDD